MYSVSNRSVSSAGNAFSTSLTSAMRPGRASPPAPAITPMVFGADHPGSTYGSAHATIGNLTVDKTLLLTQ